MRGRHSETANVVGDAPGCQGETGAEQEWWAHQDSNLGQAGYEPAALTAELWAPLLN